MPENIRTYSTNRSLVAERREHIARAVAPLLVKKGYGQTSIREIAQACNMSMGHLYYYIGGKEDVLQIMMDYDLHFYANFIKKIIQSSKSLKPVDALITVIDQFIRATDSASDFTLFFYQETKNLQPSARKIIMDRERGLIKEFEKLLVRGCEAGSFKVDNITVAANNIVMMGHMWALRRWLLGKHCSLDDYIHIQTNCVLNSISAST